MRHPELDLGSLNVGCSPSSVLRTPSPTPHPNFSLSIASQAEILPSPTRVEGKTKTSNKGEKERECFCHTKLVSRSQKSFAFTLAEVLIILGIIGVVATMTLPSLITNYQKQETVSRLKKTYSVLNQSYKRAQVENGEPANWDDPFTIGIEAYFEKYWYPYLLINKTCLTYEDCGYTSQFPWHYRNGTVFGIALISLQSRRVIILPDGTLLQIIVTLGDMSTPRYRINVDINGARKPNRIGKDVFVFIWKGDAGIMPAGYDISEVIINDECKSKGENCAAKIMQDGWEIKADFPW